MLSRMPAMGSPVPHDVYLPGLDVAVKWPMLVNAFGQGATYARMCAKRYRKLKHASPQA